MASRENQGLQLSLIFFVAVTVALSVTCYFFWKKGDEARLDAERNESKATQAQAAEQVAKAESRSLKMLLGGYAAETTMTDIQAAHEEDMALYGQILNQPVDNYRTLMTLYAPELIRISQDLIAAETKVQELTADAAAAHAQETAAVAQFREANSDLAATFQADLAQLQEPTDAMETFATNSNALVTAMLTEYDSSDATERQNLLEQIASLEERYVDLERERDRFEREAEGLQQETVDNHDGMVSWVNPESNSLYINVGTEDYLQRQMTFSIYDSTVSNLATAKPKGRIEVITLLEPHLAEARILDYTLEDPILPGDYIFSPIWQPGQQLHFGLIGELDIDGDGDDDSEVVRRLITSNGGVIDEGELYDSEGNIVRDDDTDEPLIGPQLSVATRYLVVGEAPTDRSNEGDLQRFNVVLLTARDLQIDQISLDRLLNLMGYRGTERSIGLGRYADPSDFTPRPGDDNFRERRP